MPKSLRKLHFSSATLLRAGFCGVQGIFNGFSQMQPHQRDKRVLDLITDHVCFGSQSESGAQVNCSIKLQ